MKKKVSTLLNICIILNSLATFIIYVIFKQRIVGSILAIAMLILIIASHKLEK